MTQSVRTVLRYWSSALWSILLLVAVIALTSQTGLIVIDHGLEPAKITKGNGHALSYRFDQLLFRARIFKIADDPGTAASPSVMLFENGQELGPAQSEQSVIEQSGGGAYRVTSDGATRVLIFSAKDGGTTGGGPSFNARLRLQIEPRVYRYLLLALIVIASLTILLSNGPFGPDRHQHYIAPKEVALPPTSRTTARRDAIMAIVSYGAGLAIILATINGAEFLKGRADFRLQEPGRIPAMSDSVLFWKTRALLEGEVPDKDVVFVGDSSALMSFKPKDFSAQTNLSSISLSFDGTYTIGFQNRILDLYLRTHSNPKVIVTHMALVILASGSDKDAAALYLARRDQGIRWLEDFETNRREPKFDLEGVSFFYSAKFIWRKLCGALGLPVPPDDALERSRGNFPSDTEVGKLIKASDGFYPSPAHAKAGGPAQIDFPFQLPDFEVPMFRELFAMARDHGSRLVFVTNPLSEKFDTPGNVARLDVVFARMKEIARDYPNVCLAEPFVRFFPDEEAFDNAHLVGDGIRKETEFVAQAVRNCR